MTESFASASSVDMDGTYLGDMADGPTHKICGSSVPKRKG